MNSSLPHILITNDDGVHAPGIKYLFHALQDKCQPVVVAPLLEQSATGLSTTVRQPLRLEKVNWGNDFIHNAWSVSGTPADCVKLGLNAVVKKRPDLVVSGINRGSNMGKTVLYSGTVAAAIESVMQGIPSIAFSSHDYYTEPDYAYLSKYVWAVVQFVLQNPLPRGTLLNVNFPEKALGPIKGFKMTPQGRDWWAEDLSKREHPNESHSYYWLGSKLRLDGEPDEGDGFWLRRGYATAVPVHIGDMTDHGHLQASKELFESSVGV